MRKGKRLLSILLTAAMVITGVNLGTLTPVKAAEVKSETYYREINGEFIGTHAKAESGQGYITVADSANKEAGSPTQAAYKSGITLDDSGSIANCGSNRYGCIVFEIPQDLDFTNLNSATVAMDITGANNVDNANCWVRVALYQTDNTYTGDGTDESQYRALNNDYSYDAGMWSEEKITNRDNVADTVKSGTIHFDVKKAVENVAPGGNLVMRVQVPRGGVILKSTTSVRLTIDATTPTKATIKYIDEQGAEIQDSKQVDVSVGSAYTYDMTDNEKQIETDSGIYVYDETSNATITEVKESADENVINLVYKKAELRSVVAPATIFAIDGNEPILPKQLTANTNIEGFTLPVDVAWEDISDKKWMVGDNTVQGTAEGLEGEAAKVTATVHVYECDESVEDIVASDDKVTTQLKNDYQGVIETEYDIVKTGELGGDPSVVYFDKGVTDTDKFWQTATSTRFTNGKFFVNGGNGKGGGASDSGSKDYPAEADRTVEYDGTKVYRVRTQIDTTGVAATGNGTYRVWVTDPDGNTTEITNPEDPMTFRKVATGIIDKAGAAKSGFKVINHKIFWQSGYATAQVDIQDSDGNKIADSVTFKYLPASSQTMDTSIFTPKSVDGKTYLFDAANSGWDADGDGAVDTPATNTATMPAAGNTIKYMAVYKEAAFIEQAETIEVETLTGKNPILPTTVKATYEGMDEPVATEVTWDYDKFDFTKETEDNAPLRVTGTFETGEQATATVHVKHAYLLASYTFDGVNPAADSTGKHADAELKNAATTDIAGVDSGSTGVKLAGGSNGTSYVKLPDDLLQLTAADGVSKITQDDFTVSMFINRESNGNSFAMILHATEINKAWSSTASNSGPAGHIGLINRDDCFDVEYRKDRNTVPLKAVNDENEDITTPINQWTHIAIVTNGSNGTAKLYQDGVLVGTIDGIYKLSELPAQNNYLGRSSWTDNDYKATFDDFQVYNGLLTEAEIQEIANGRLCKAPVQNIYDNLALSLKSGETFNKDAITEDLNLPTTMETSDGKAVQGLKITWESDNPAIRTDGTVVQPSKGRGDATVTLKAKIQYGSYTMTKEFTNLKVLEGDSVSFVEFDEKFAEAQAKYEEVLADKVVYVQSTIDALREKLEEAKSVKATEGTDAEDADAVDDMTEQLQEAMDGVRAKSLAEVSRTLAAWYPLDDSEDKVKDISGNGKDGTAAETVTFSRENGATFNGGTALKNCITLPTDMEIQDQMTFAFWAKDARGSKSNAFGIGSGDGFGDANKTDAHFFYVSTNDSSRLLASMNPKYWASGTPVNITTPAAAKDTWHHITCVLSGTKLTLYMNGRKIETKDVGYTIKDMWDADPNTRNIYIGNCIYGKNGDADYKGSIRDFRIYNAPLAQEQVKEIYDYLKTPEMKYAKDDLMEAMGARVEDDGTVILNVTNLTTTDGKLTLPSSGYGDARISWKSSDNEVINDTTGVAAIPEEDDLETMLEADLTATITIGEGESQITEKIVFKCKVYYALDIPTDDLQKAIQDVRNKMLEADDYTAGSWGVLENALKAAQAQVDRPTSVQAVSKAKSDLEAAESGLINISELRNRVEDLEDELYKLEENDYTTASWDALQDKLDDAKGVLENPNATKEAVEGALGTLPETAASALKACGDKTRLEEAIAAAELLEKYEAAYTEESWAELKTALQAAKNEQAKRLEDYTEAAEDLENVIDALVIKDEHKLEGAVKEELDAKLAAAKAEAESLASSNYTRATWEAYQNALTAFEAVLGKEKATTDEAKDAAKALEEARAALEPVEAQKPTEEKKKELADAYEAATQAAANMKQEEYTAESWSRYQNALEAMKAVSERLAEESNNVTKDEIDAAIAELDAATAALVKSVDKTALDKAIKDYGSLSSSAYTSATWKAFQTALNAAKTISAKANATQAEVDSALATLNAKKNALKLVVKVTKVTVSADSKSIAAGKKATLKFTVKPTNATTKTVTWSTSNKNYATVSSKGVVTTKKAGAGKTVTITATAKDGSKKKGTIKIKIMKNAVTKVTLKAKAKKVKAGKKVTVKATVKTNGKKVNKTLTWKSSNTKWATVNSKGVVTTKKAGAGKTVTITATSTDGTKKSAKVKIKITK